MPGAWTVFEGRWLAPDICAVGALGGASRNAAACVASLRPATSHVTTTILYIGAEKTTESG